MTNKTVAQNTHLKPQYSTTMNIHIDGASETRKGEEIPLEDLNDYLNQAVPELGKVLEIRQFAKGFSNLTYLLTTQNGHEYVLRRPPFGAKIKSAHDMGREFRVLQALRPHFRYLPQPVHFCESAAFMDGAGFYIMQRLRGFILRPTEAFSAQINPTTMQQMSLTLVDTLVELHKIDIQTTGLAQLGKPDGYVQRQVLGWIQRYQNAETDRVSAMDALAHWLQNSAPRAQKPAFLHNDYKFDNVIYDTEHLSKIVGILDWEMSTVGDPLMDLGASLAYWVEAHEGPTLRLYNATWMPGNLSRQQVIERYALQSGRDLTDILFYYVFGLYKNAVITQQIYKRWKDGSTQDARFKDLILMVKYLSERGTEALDKGVV